MKENLTVEETSLLIPLAAAHVNQYTTKEGKTPWEVQENVTNDLLAVLPRELTESQVFAALHFAQKFELLGFNIGMKHMSAQLFDAWTKEKENLLKVIEGLTAANDRLADKLGSFIGEEE